MISNCIIGIWNTLIIALGVAIALGGWFLLSHSWNDLPTVYLPDQNAGDIYHAWTDPVPQGLGLKPIYFEMSALVNSAVNVVTLPIIIVGIVIAALGVFGCIAFSCKVRWMAWLYIIIMFALLVVELVWGIACVIAKGNDKYPLFDEQIRGEITDIFTGAAVPDYTEIVGGDATKNPLYCMNPETIAKQYVPTGNWPVDVPAYDGEFTQYFVDPLNKLNLPKMQACQYPKDASDAGNCPLYMSDCKENVNEFLIWQVYYAGLCTLILAIVTFIIWLFCLYSAIKMGKEKAAQAHEVKTQTKYDNNPMVQAQNA